MNTQAMALDYIKRAGRCLRESRDALEDNDYPIAIRRAQECVELSLKAVLRCYAVEYPREHEVSDSLEAVGGRFPGWFSSRIGEFIRISRDLGKKRGPAMYGYEAGLRPASDIFSKKDAEDAFGWAQDVHDSCTRLIHEHMR
ncbi:MAG TPA: HEPN domain-containing protein [Candidatus Methanoperedenaceae archaeon]|nr:HEPN domain-containing protein [Candidatus Methanoperedenaceae archaeon]